MFSGRSSRPRRTKHMIGESIKLGESAGVIIDVTENRDGDVVVIVKWLDGPNKGKFSPIGSWDLKPRIDH